MRKTKIICTLGPSTDDEKILTQLIQKGMDVARLNFSHGTHEMQGKRMEQVRKIRNKLKKPVGILLDTKGPEIRTGTFANGSVLLREGQSVTLTGKDVPCTEQNISISFPLLYRDVSPGTRILIDDGLVEMKVLEICGEDIVCTVENSGVVSNYKGVNVPGIHLGLPYISNQDKKDILYGIEQEVDFIAASFIRSAEDIRQIRTLLQDNGGEGISLIAKIENQEGVDNIDEIIEEADGIMIARGDLGVELPGEEVPIVQKMIIKKVYKAGKQVITATQMLDSMIKNPRPTRAETTDVANAIYDGTSALMLSGETAAGKYPVEALQTMVGISTRTENDIDYRKRFFHYKRPSNPDITDAISHATCTTALDLNASAIITVTKSGRSAKMVSRYRPPCPIIGGTIDERVSRQLNLSWGVTPVLLHEKNDILDLISHAISVSKEKELLKKNDIVVTTSGVPLGISGTTNLIKVQCVE